MDKIGEEYNYWEANMLLHNEDLDRSWELDEALTRYYDSSSPDGSGAWSSSSSASATSKNIVSERNRRKKLNERLFALRAIVPNIGKMDKASTIKDAINYIKQLQEEEKKIQAEISELEYSKPENNYKNTDSMFESQASSCPQTVQKRRKRRPLSTTPAGPTGNPRWKTLRISFMGDKTVAVNLICSQRRDTMVKLCEVFEPLGLKVITANITTFSGRLLKTLLVEVDSEEKDNVKAKIETALATLSDPHNAPISI